LRARESWLTILTVLVIATGQAGGQSVPTVADVSHGDVTWATVDLETDVTGDPPPDVWFYLNPAGTPASPTVPENWAIEVSAGSGTGTISESAWSLEAGVTYYCRARATNSEGSVWSENSVSLTTSTTVPPEVTLHANHNNWTSEGNPAPPMRLYYDASNYIDLPVDAGGWYDFSRLGPTPITFNLGGYTLSSDGAYRYEHNPHMKLKLNGGDIIGTDATFYISEHDYWEYPGYLYVRGAANMSVGEINTRYNHNNYGSRSYAAYVELGTETSPLTGNLRIDRLRGGSYDLDHGVTRHYIYARGDVKIENSSGTWGDVEARGKEVAGDYHILHVYQGGAFRCRDILSMLALDGNDGRSLHGRITLYGNYYAMDDPSGDCEVRDIKVIHGVWWAEPQDITVRGYRNVSINTIQCTCEGYDPGHTDRTYLRRNATRIINVANDITLSGVIPGTESSIDLWADPRNSGSYGHGNLTMKCGRSITMAALNKERINELRLSVTLDGTVTKKDWMWVWIQSEPLGLTVNEGLKRVTAGFTALDSHVYYTDDGGALSGEYDIYVGGTDTGWDLKELAFGAEPPPVPKPGTMLMIW